jgi:hypothetical protein
MQIIYKTPQENGAYPAIQSWDGAKPPDGYLEVPAWVSTDVFYEYKGFVILTVKKTTVIAMEANEDAYAAWEAQQPPDPPDPEPDTDPTADKILTVLLGV